MDITEVNRRTAERDKLKEAWEIHAICVANSIMDLLDQPGAREKFSAICDDLDVEIAHGPKEDTCRDNFGVLLLHIEDYRKADDAWDRAYNPAKQAEPIEPEA